MIINHKVDNKWSLFYSISNPWARWRKTFPDRWGKKKHQGKSDSKHLQKKCWPIGHVKVQLDSVINLSSYLVCRLSWLWTAAAPTKRSCQGAADNVAHSRAYCHPSSCGSHLGHEARPLWRSWSWGQGGRRWMSRGRSMEWSWATSRTKTVHFLCIREA